MRSSGWTRRPYQSTHSFPTRRSSDLGSICVGSSDIGGLSRRSWHVLQYRVEEGDFAIGLPEQQLAVGQQIDGLARTRGARRRDRKSTRLNSSHSQISYAVFCMKNKNT